MKPRNNHFIGFIIRTITRRSYIYIRPGGGSQNQGGQCIKTSKSGGAIYCNWLNFHVQEINLKKKSQIFLKTGGAIAPPAPQAPPALPSVGAMQLDFDMSVLLPPLLLGFQMQCKLISLRLSTELLHIIISILNQFLAHRGQFSGTEHRFYTVSEFIC